MQHISTALHSAPPPVRAGSVPVGSERGWWRAMTRQEANRLVLAARRYELTTRAPGKRNGALGHVALEALSLLANLVSQRTGRLEPSYAYLCATLRRSRDAVTRALAALQAHGFLDRLRRYEPVHRDGPGPRIKQAPNAYRLALPRRAAALIGALIPEPDTGAPEREPTEEVKAFRSMLDGILADLPCESGQRGERRTRKA